MAGGREIRVKKEKIDRSNVWRVELVTLKQHAHNIILGFQLTLHSYPHPVKRLFSIFQILLCKKSGNGPGGRG